MALIFSLFRQLKEQSKKLIGVKRNQQLEREKQAELLNEVKKKEDQKGETAEFFQVVCVSNSGWEGVHICRRTGYGFGSRVLERQYS